MGLFRRSSENDDGGDYRLFYSSDLHGSELAWRKFLSAGRVHNVSTLIMGGDLTGKAIVPVVQQGETATAEFQGRTRELAGEEELAQFEEAVRTNGFYPYRCSNEESERLLGGSQEVERLFREVMIDQIKRWVALADERLAGSGVELLVMPGNDDEFYLDKYLDGEHVKNCNERCIGLGDYQLYSLGWSTTTPWDTPREATEEGIWEKIVALIDGVEDFERAIFNFHEPPYNSGLDLGPELTEDLEVVKQGGEPKRVPIGSHSVRRAIEEFQPLLALHGHVHESRGVVKIGRTMCINPGSRYSEGVVDGAVLSLRAAEVRTHQLVTG